MDVYAIESISKNKLKINHFLDRYRVDADDEDVPNLRPIPKGSPHESELEKDLEKFEEDFFHDKRHVQNPFRLCSRKETCVGYTS